MNTTIAFRRALSRTITRPISPSQLCTGGYLTNGIHSPLVTTAYNPFTTTVPAEVSDDTSTPKPKRKRKGPIPKDLNRPIDVETDALPSPTNAKARKQLLKHAMHESRLKMANTLRHQSILDKQVSQSLADEMPTHHKQFGRIRFFPSFPNEYPPTDITKLDPTPLRRPVAYNEQRTGVIAKKVGMMTLFDKTGMHRPITICKLDCVQVVQIKTERNSRRGTFNLQLGYGSQKIRRLNWSKLGHFAKQGVAPKRKLHEFPVGKDALLPVGTEISVRHFIPGQYVDVKGTTKGKGFQGVMKRWGFKGGPATHGATKFHRKRGSFGGCSDPGKVFKGKRMPGNMGNASHTMSSVRVFRIEPKQNLIYIMGHIAGHADNYVYIRDAHFKPPSNPPLPTFFPDPNEEELPEFMEWNAHDVKFWYEKDPNPDMWGDKVSPDLL